MALNRRELLIGLSTLGSYPFLSARAGSSPSESTITDSFTSPLPQAAAQSQGKKVIVVGAGIGGLVSAYELQRAGFDVTVIEARDRVGGRNWTLRGGDKVEYTDGTTQTVQFDKGFYFNAGPARIPSHHQIMLGYCRELGVELEVVVNTSRNALVRPDLAEPPFQLRQAVNDARGYIAELLTQSVENNTAATTLSKADRKSLQDFLKIWGDLSDKQTYEGSARSGYKTLPGAGNQLPLKREPVPLKSLLNPALWTALVIDEYPEFSPTMFQPVGGMDQIPKAFHKRLGERVRFNSEVQAINSQEQSASVVVKDRLTSQITTLTADYVVVTLPLPLLAKLQTNFSQPVKDAIAATEFGFANKVAWQAPRFWETDLQIYGGLSFLNHDAYSFWYPSGGFQQPEGVLIGAYNNGEVARRFGEKTHAEQIALSKQAVELLHPNRSQLLKNPIAISWSRIPYSLGPWSSHEVKQPAYDLLNQPQGRVHLSSDSLAHSGIGIWQESAAASARRVAQVVLQHASQASSSTSGAAA